MMGYKDRNGDAGEEVAQPPHPPVAPVSAATAPAASSSLSCARHEERGPCDSIRAALYAIIMAIFTYLLASSLYLFSTVESSALRCRHDAPVVAVKNGSYSGVYSAEYKQDFFLGMPYAQPPARFTVSEGLDASWDGVRPATAYPPHCVGYGGDMIGYETSEDCLYLNVVRPAGISASAQLPVAVWIHGGGLFMGGSADKRYNMSFMVENSVQLGTPIIGVSLNYRLSAFGFIGGKEVMDAGATNLGFRDQRLALHWVHENIAAFGGSPDKVTIFGESSGAESITAQVFAYNGRDDGLFRGAMAQSGFGGMINRVPGGFNNTKAIQSGYDSLVGTVSSCASLVGSPSSLDCLRNASFEELNRALNGTGAGPFSPVLDKDFIADFHANQVARGDFVHVPLLIGANTDEGSAFGVERGPNGGRVNSDADMREAIGSLIPPEAAETTGKSADRLIDELMYAYPNIQSVGIPSLKTWPHVIKPNDSFAQQYGVQTRRVRALFGDLSMQYSRRRANIGWSKHGVPSYAYRFDVTVNPLPDFVGATHFQEVAFVFNNLNGDGYAANPFGGSGSYPQQAKALAKSISSAWISFVANQNPNGPSTPVEGRGSWPAYDVEAGGGVGEGIVFSLDGSYVEMDDWRAEGMGWMIENALTVFGN